MTSRKLLYETKPELMLRQALEDRGLRKGIDFAIQFPVKNSFIIDIAFTTPIRVAIEVDGRKWHDNPAAQKYDRFKDMILKRLGWTVLRFWDDEVYEKTDVCVDIIMKTLLTQKSWK